MNFELNRAPIRDPVTDRSSKNWVIAYILSESSESAKFLFDKPEHKHKS